MARLTVDSLNAELTGTGVHVARCAQDYGYRYFLFLDTPGFSAIERVGIHAKPIGWSTLRAARDEMLGLVRVNRAWDIIHPYRRGY